MGLHGVMQGLYEIMYGLYGEDGCFGNFLGG